MVPGSGPPRQAGDGTETGPRPRLSVLGSVSKVPRRSGRSPGSFAEGDRIRPEISDLQIALGETLLETGQDREAETYLENARRLDPNDPRLVKDLERLHKKDEITLFCSTSFSLCRGHKLKLVLQPEKALKQRYS